MKLDTILTVDEMFSGAMRMDEIRKEIGGLSGEFYRIKSRIMNDTGNNTTLAPYGICDADFFECARSSLWMKAFETLRIFDLISNRDSKDMKSNILNSNTPFTPDNVNKLIGDSAEIRGQGRIRFIKSVYADHISCKYNGSGDTNRMSKLDNLQKIESQFRIYSRDVFWDKSWNSFQYSYNDIYGNSFAELLRVCYILDDKLAETNYFSCFRTWDAKPKDKKGVCLIETDYFDVVHSKNGNAKVTFKRKDILDKLNIIGSGDPTSLPDRMRKRYKKEDIDQTIDFSADKMKVYADENFFETPSNVIESILKAMPDDAFMNVRDALEPSFCGGAIACFTRSHIRRLTGNEIRFDGYEINTERFNSASSIIRKIGRDFMTHTTLTYDLIMMNPPFSGNRDVLHFIHAWEFLRPGGWIMCIMANGRSGKGNALSKWFKRICRDEASYYDSFELEEGAFKSSGTNVSTECHILQKGV